MGSEVGGREVVCQAEMSMEDATAQATSLQKEYKRVRIFYNWGNNYS